MHRFKLEFAGFENDQQPSGILPGQLLLVFIKENGSNQGIKKNNYLERLK